LIHKHIPKREQHAHGHSHAHTHVRVTPISRQHAKTLEKLQYLCYPTLTDEEIFSAEKYLHHIQIFPEGQVVALSDVEGRPTPVGAASAFRTNPDFFEHDHTFEEAIAGGWLSHHKPHGEWLYGVDIMVHPEFRGRGIGSALYKARWELVRRLNLRGMVAGGMMPGYQHYKKHMTVEQFVHAVSIGKAYCPTLSMQLKNGFKIRRILYNHITDPRANNCAALIVRENPDYRPGAVITAH
jgi:GNAT superfamily N-acetyltransferase